MAIDNSIYSQQQSPDLLGNIQKGLSISNSMKDQKRQEQQALAQQNAAEQQALAERKQKEVQLLARSGRGVKDQAGYDSLLKTAKFMGHDISQLPPQWGADAQGMIASLASNELGVDKQIGIETDAKGFEYTKEKDAKAYGIDQQRLGLDKTKANRDYEMKLADMGLTREQFEEQKNQNTFGNELKTKELALMGREKSKAQEYRDAKLAEIQNKGNGKSAEMSVAESKQLGLYKLGLEAEKQYQAAVVDPNEYNPTSPGQFIDNDTTGWVPNVWKNDKAKESQAAQSSWVEAFLRDASGAAIPPSERGPYAVDFFPQPGDTPTIIANKERLRQQKMENARISSGEEAGPQIMQSKKSSSPPDEATVQGARAELAKRKAVAGGR